MLIPFDHQGSITNLANDINRARYQYFADVINCSWRTLAEDPSDPTKYINYSFPVIEEAIENAIQAGIVVVASAGNPPDQWNGLDPSEYPPYTLYPAAYTGVIAVSATNSSDNFPNGYNYGSHVDVSAPSISILTTNTNNSYGTYNGTSFGSPLTAALAGLCLSINPDLNNSDVEAIIENNSEDLGTTGWDDYFGEGRIDAFEALKHTPTWNNVIKNNMYGYNGGSIKYQSTSYTSPYTIPEYFWKQNVQAVNQSYGGIDYAFSHWNDGIKNPYRELELENDGNYTAVYTGHLYSTST
ncbi:MAG: S8/S53 family peptidase, partial [Gammaproteobacteria bacterium]|nr:S8/S53 family peptidase [Gammaproteobacteria bacterium]